MSLSKKSEGQRRRYQTDEGKAHMAKMREAAAAAHRSRRVIPPEFKQYNKRMRLQGIPQAERFAAIRKAIEEQRT